MAAPAPRDAKRVCPAALEARVSTTGLCFCTTAADGWRQTSSSRKQQDSFLKMTNCRFVQGRHPCRGWFVGNAGRRDQRVGLTHFHAALAWRVQKKALEWSSSVHREPIRLRPNTSLSMSRKTATDRRALRPTTASLSRLTTRGDGGNAERATTAFRQRRQAEAEYYRMEALLSKIGLLCASDVLSASLRRASMCLVVSG